MQAKDVSYDIVTVDVIWTAEWAAKGWLVPLKDKFALDTSKLLKAPVDAATYNGTLYAAPFASDGGLLYYRKDLVPTPPKTLDEMWSMCSIAKKNGIACYAGQFTKYEGLTCNATEAINTFGGKVVDAAGQVHGQQPGVARRACRCSPTTTRTATSPRRRSPSRRSRVAPPSRVGKLLFLRNWPYVYNLAKTDASSKVKDKFAVAPLPGVSGPGASTLGGHSEAISVYSKYKATAFDFLKFIEADEQQKFFMEKGSLAPVVESIYSDAALVAKYPYLPTLLTSIKNAIPRPGHAVLPRRDHGHPGQLLRRDQGREVRRPGDHRHGCGHQVRQPEADPPIGSGGAEPGASLRIPTAAADSRTSRLSLSTWARRPP